jgi:hypothetical protein
MTEWSNGKFALYIVCIATCILSAIVIVIFTFKAGIRLFNKKPFVRRHIIYIASAAITILAANIFIEML